MRGNRDRERSGTCREDRDIAPFTSAHGKNSFRGKGLALLFFLTLCFLFLPLSVSAEETENPTDSLPEEYADFLSSIPDDIAEFLPESLFTSDPEVLADGVSKLGSFSSLLSISFRMLNAEITPAIRLFATVCGLLLLSSVCSALRSSFSSENVARAFGFCSTLVIFSLLFTQCYVCFSGVADYFSSLSRLFSAWLPLMSVLLSVGGNIATAAASVSGLSVYLWVLESFVGNSILPFCGICLSFALISAINPNVRLESLSGTVKKHYTTILTFLMMLLVAMLASQTLLAARADTLTMKSARFAAGNLIPVVGGSISELLRSVGAGVGYLRGTVGISGVLLLLLLLLPTLLQLLLFRFVFDLCTSLADLLSCTAEKKLLGEISSLCGYLVAGVSIVSSVGILSLSLFLRCTAAVGG